MSQALPINLQKRAVRRFVQLLLLLRGDRDDPLREDFFRADRNCLCPGCNQRYGDHPQDPFEPWLEVLCSGERVKL